MLVLLVVWFICSFIFITFGKLLINIFAIFSKNNTYTIYDTFFLGICFVGTVLSILSIWTPINQYSAWGLILFSASYASYLYYIKKEFFLPTISVAVKRWHKQTVILVLLSIVVILYYCLLPPLIFDMRLYYLQSIIWNESYPIIPGLANIHGRFGFNSNILLLSSALSFKDIFSFRTFGVLGASFIVLLIWIIRQMNNSQYVWRNIGLALVSFALVYVYKGFISAPSTDVLPNIMVIYLLLKAILDKDSLFKSPLVFWVLAIYSMTLKLSVIPICLFCIFIIIELYKEKSYRTLSFMMFIGVFVVGAWCIRTVMLSGYLIYPYPSIDIFNVDWKVPEALASIEKASVSSWAKMPGVGVEEFAEMHFFDWIKIWMFRHVKYLPLHLFAYCLAAISPLVMLILSKRKLIQSKSYFLLWGIAFLGFIFWFILAPDGRFGMSFILITAFAPVLFLANKSENIIVNKIPYVFFILSFLFLLHSGVDIHRNNKGDKDIISYLYAPQTIEVVNKKDSTIFIEKHVGDLVIYAPNNFLCSDHNIPCMPFFEEEYTLEMRGKCIQDGFRLINNKQTK